MAKQTHRKLNNLERQLPEGLLVDASWLEREGYSTALRHQYVAAGWLEQPTRRVYRRRRGSLSWQQVVISLQMLLDYPLHVGGRTALELDGFAHYLATAITEVHLYGPKIPPKWLYDLQVDGSFVYHNDRKVFGSANVASFPWRTLDAKIPGKKILNGGLTSKPWGHWDWPLVLSTPERAILELLDELPKRESWHQVDMLFQSLSNLSPRHLQKLLADCRSVKVKRLFFFFAGRHQHAWLKQIKKDAISLGAGKRMLVKGGRFDPTHQITVPEDLDAL
jgi:hypothetical protein